VCIHFGLLCSTNLTTGFDWAVAPGASLVLGDSGDQQRVARLVVKNSTPSSIRRHTTDPPMLMRDSRIRTICKAASWLLIFAIASLSLVPPAYRTVTHASQNAEHFAIFFAAGVSFGVGYPNRPIVSGLALLIFCAAIELAQQWVPRLGDFVVDVSAVCIGVGTACLAARLHHTR
jgi:hypothetical protein